MFKKIFNKKKQLIRYKTDAWKNQSLADNHFKVSGVKAQGAFVPIINRIARDIPTGSRILDVGCGHGRLAFTLAENGYKVVASDVSEAMLSILQANKGSLDLEVRQCDAHNLKASDEEFDAVISYDFMPHFPDWPDLLKEQARVCKKGGQVIFAINLKEHRTLASKISQGNYTHPYSFKVGEKGKHFWAETSIAEATKAGKGANMTLTEIIPIKFLYDNLIIGKCLGREAYEKVNAEFHEKLKSSEEIGDFYAWLEENYFQHLEPSTSYHNILVFKKE
jgi:ubiquinone/menaquinone biosynthesis C-methylase UbiE